MSDCPSCGNPLISGARFCNACGAPLAYAQPDVVQCPRCGSVRRPGARFCNVCGAVFPAPQQFEESNRRCARCGSPWIAGARFCNVCGASENERQAPNVPQAKRALELKRKHGVAALVMIWLALLLTAAFIVLLLQLVGNALFDSWARFARKTLPAVLLIAVPVLLAILTAAWGASRVRGMKAAGMTAEQYKRALEAAAILPQAAASSPQPGVPAGKKPMTQSAMVVLLSVMLAVSVGISVWIGPEGLSADFGTQSAMGEDSGAGTGGRLSGRWEGQVIPNTTDNHGVTLVQGDSVAIVFRGDKAYWGSSMMDDQYLIEVCEAGNGAITTYSVGSGTITFSGSGTSMTYDFDGTTIYIGEYEVRRVD